MIKNDINSRLGPGTSVGSITLFVKDLEKMKDFYANMVGLQVLEKGTGSYVLGFGEDRLITLMYRDYPKASLGSAGLYHTAILFPDRESLVKSMISVLEQNPEAFEGSADHAVSWAFYFHDPEGNGVELYADRTKEEWKWSNGFIYMKSEYIDPILFIRENNTNTNIHLSAKIGHIHLKVGDLDEAKRFYTDICGFDITAIVPLENPSALFVSAGGYHHHIGLNTWESLGAKKRSESLGLAEFEIKLSNIEELNNLLKRLAENQINYELNGTKLSTQDPWGNKIIFSKID
jgi:catechol 2,3-dioxygenase